MSWVESNLSLRLATELRIGYLMRENARQARAIEDRAASSLRAVAER